jgi:hypothetical protein
MSRNAQEVCERLNTIILEDVHIKLHTKDKQTRGLEFCLATFQHSHENAYKWLTMHKVHVNKAACNPQVKSLFLQRNKSGKGCTHVA